MVKKAIDTQWSICVNLVKLIQITNSFHSFKSEKPVALLLDCNIFFIECPIKVDIIKNASHQNFFLIQTKIKIKVFQL